MVRQLRKKQMTMLKKDIGAVKRSDHVLQKKGWFI